MMLLLSTFALVVQVVAAADPPKYIHLTWNTNDLAHTIVVTWSTTVSGSGDIVNYGTSSSELIYSATGSYHTYSGSSLFVHDVVLSGLSPDTTYYFICGGSGIYSSVRAFHTAPMTSGPITFVDGGDSHASQTNKVSREQVSRMMATFDPSFVVYTGDFCDTDTSSNWPLYLVDMENNWIGNNGFTIPLIGAVGNHEGSANTFRGQFNLPGNELWYSLDWGQDLHIIVLDSEYDVSGSQLAWLKQDLATYQNVKWKVVLFHQPPYSSGWHGSNTVIRNAWCSVFDQYGVDLVFNGHDHDYERSKPIYNNAIVTNPDDSTTYVVSGGWGGSLRSVGTNWWTAYSKSYVYHFIVVTIDGNMLSLKAYDQNGALFDSVQWQKNTEPNNPPTAAFSYSPPNPTANIPIQFTDQSNDLDGIITSWSWNFGDGGISTVKNPTHQYLTAGTYTVTLTVTDNLGGIGSSTQTITVTPETTYVLTISVNPLGAGTTNPSVGVYNYAEGSQVTITATAASGYVFDSWGGDASGTSPTITVTMSSNKNVIANFKTPTNLALKKSATADSSQWRRSPAYGNDGNTATRWCAANGYLNHWWKVDLGGTYSLTGTEIIWESAKNYKYKIEVSANNINWVLVVDKTKNILSTKTMNDSFVATARYVRITVTSLPSYTWASFYEFRVFGI
jgi:uncharacterized repeat protein (TIGR02543 family)